MRRFILIMLSVVATQALADPKLTVFDCGSLQFDDVTSFGLTNEETDVREMFVPCYVIENNGQRLLWDGGLPLAIAGAGEQAMGNGTTMSYERSLIEQMKDVGLSPSDIDYAAFSHFHFDHVGAGNEFVGSTLLIQQTEYEAAFEHYEDNPVFDITLYADLANAKHIALDGDHDVFGDGSVQIISTPGHTPGHQALLVNLKETGPIILSGDLYHFEFSRKERRVPDFNTDKAQTLESMDLMEQRIKDTGATLWIEHNRALADTLKLAPSFYE